MGALVKAYRWAGKCWAGLNYNPPNLGWKEGRTLLATAAGAAAILALIATAVAGHQAATLGAEWGIANDGGKR